VLPATFTCPRCKCHALYVARRRGLDWLVSAIGLRPVRCMTCDKRFYLRYSQLKAHGADARKHAYAQGEPGKAESGKAEPGKAA